MSEMDQAQAKLARRFRRIVLVLLTSSAIMIVSMILLVLEVVAGFEVGIGSWFG